MEKKQIKAATLIQRMFRRYREKKLHLERLRARNEERRLRGEEEERWQAKEEVMKTAAQKVQAAWRGYRVRVMKNINSQLANALRHSHGQIDVVLLPQIRKCAICRKETAVK